ncbi:bifunctional sugar-1-phosphate nucleotidylyltransferase/acetyltransferase [Methanonatronarchaeum sp. AMET-Sl]|uniref:bifunctional sugar-1-phosphate nucleotidylyltransferase/acetyltransferase n=1 Tax=Methanonatronarchaeum sp. AMET-Sl TaxID=3037654 RepID=UPI00244DF2A0|nr:bifunctional sugar-1-phosphate nucleotidylyltransferase/acetyltransferase [Methanonatronarchaeum sp. AMET-Sl]WGI17667.1 sugar phosphate nucleotidyltransferase [Methanonatronarchaeum sp. AMET-Sl]
MEAVVLAAGEGSRMRPFTYNRPKVMLPVGNKPILEYVVESLSNAGIDKVVLVVGYRKERLQSYFGDGKDWDVDIVYREQSRQLGTAHALSQVRQEVGSEFLVVNGDSIIDEKPIKSLKEKGNSIVFSFLKDTDDYGVITTENGRVDRVFEKPGNGVSNKVVTGLYKFTDEVFRAIDRIEISERGEYELGSAVQKMIEDGERVEAIELDGFWMDGVYPWDLLKMNSKIISEQQTEHKDMIEDNVFLDEGVKVGENSRVRSGSYIMGPAKIGQDCEIGPNTVILPSTTIGDNCTIKPNTTIENSIVMDDSTIGANSSISNSIIGYNLTSGSHLSCHSDQTEVKINKEIYEVNHLGALIGDGCKLGTNVTVMPGTIVGVDCEVGSAVKVDGNTPNNVCLR